MTEITPFARAYAPVLRVLARQDPTLTTMPDIARAAGKVPSNVRRDWPKLVAGALVEPLPALSIAPEGRAVLLALAAEAVAGLEGANVVRERAAGDAPEGYAAIRHALIVPDPLNPRRHFDPDAIAELAESIAEKGLQQNLVVRPAGTLEGTPFAVHRLVAGERRWRAIAKLIEDGRWPRERPVSCKVSDLDDTGHAVVALLENLQREDLKPLEEAEAFRRLVDEHGFKTADIAARINASQRLVQQRMQLLDLPELQRSMVDQGVMTIDGARQWLASRPKAAEVTVPQLLMLAEIARRLFVKVEVRANVRSQVDWRVRSDLVMGELGRLKLANHIHDYNDGSYHVELTARGVITLLDRAPDFNKGPAAYERLRAELADPAALTRAKEDGRFITPWLNKPFARDPDTIRREQERAAERRAADKAREQKDRQDAEERVREVEAGAAFMRAIRAFEAEAPGLDAQAFQDRFRALMAAHECDGPWTITLAGTPPEARIIDAKGRENVGRGQVLEARRRLIIIALNHAAGFAAISGPKLVGEEDEDTRCEICGDPVAGLCACGHGGSEDEDEPADNPEDEDAGLSPALKKLAGVK